MLADLDSTDCYCDQNDNVERYDEGLIVDESTLPIVRLINSDTGSSSEEAWMNVGPLECEGNGKTM